MGTGKIRLFWFRQGREPRSLHSVELLVIFHQYHAWTHLGKSVASDTTLETVLLCTLAISRNIWLLSSLNYIVLILHPFSTHAWNFWQLTFSKWKYERNTVVESIEFVIRTAGHGLAKTCQKCGIVFFVNDRDLDRKATPTAK